MSKAIKTNTGEVSPVLNQNKSVCTINEIEIKIMDIIDFKSASEEIKLSTGKILEFRSIDGFVWMNIQDMTDQMSTKEWISCRNWYDQYKQRSSSQTPKHDTSNKPANNKKHIF